MNEILQGLAGLLFLGLSPPDEARVSGGTRLEQWTCAECSLHPRATLCCTHLPLSPPSPLEVEDLHCPRVRDHTFAIVSLMLGSVRLT